MEKPAETPERYSHITLEHLGGLWAEQTTAVSPLGKLSQEVGKRRSELAEVDAVTIPAGTIVKRGERDRTEGDTPHIPMAVKAYEVRVPFTTAPTRVEQAYFVVPDPEDTNGKVLVPNHILAPHLSVTHATRSE